MKPFYQIGCKPFTHLFIGIVVGLHSLRSWISDIFIFLDLEPRLDYYLIHLKWRDWECSLLNWMLMLLIYSIIKKIRASAGSGSHAPSKIWKTRKTERKKTYNAARSAEQGVKLYIKKKNPDTNNTWIFDVIIIDCKILNNNNGSIKNLDWKYVTNMPAISGLYVLGVVVD